MLEGDVVVPEPVTIEGRRNVHLMAHDRLSRGVPKSLRKV